MRLPGTTPRRDIIFKNYESGEYNPLEKQLSWPAGTLSILEQAFQQRLGRFDRWIIPPGVNPEPFTQAATVFKRGVHTNQTKTQMFRGRYSINFFSSAKVSVDNLQHSDLCIVDKNVYSSWSIFESIQTNVIEIDESNKNLPTVGELVELLHRSHSKTINIIGGGVLADTTAFACSLLAKPFRLIPTTLLSMVDACIGGKTGVNYHPYGKNQLGLFAFPAEVIITSDWLTSLSERDFLSGKSECMKHAFLSGDQGLIEQVARISKKNIDLELLIKIINIKASIIKEDPSEVGRRATLNLGHTLAHALEKIADETLIGPDRITHGEAVALGLFFQTFLSDTLGGDEKSNRNQRNSLRQAQLIPNKTQLEKLIGQPVSMKLKDKIWENIFHDKKNLGNNDSTSWIVLEKVGKVKSAASNFITQVDKKDFDACWEKFNDNLEAT